MPLSARKAESLQARLEALPEDTRRIVLLRAADGDETSLQALEAVTGAGWDAATGGALHGALIEDLERELDRVAPPTGGLEGTTVGPIRIDELLGVGGMGEVYRGFDTRLERKVAVKCLRRDRSWTKQARERAAREARILSQLNHPALCQIYDLVEHEEAELLLIEYVEGRTLADFLDEHPSEESLLDVAEQILEGLGAAHSRGVVHRDLKPGNVMVDRGGAAKILDFGIASRTGSEDVSRPGRQPGQQSGQGREIDVADSRLTAEGQILGTVGAMSPEQARGERATPASDLYSFGILLLEALCGRSAYAGSRGIELLRRVRDAAVDFPPSLPSAMASFLQRLLAADPEARPTAPQALAQLRKLRRSRGRRQRLGALVFTAMAIAVGIGWFFANREAPVDSTVPTVTQQTVAAASTVALLDFDGEEAGVPAWLGEAVPEILSARLAERPTLHVVPRRNVALAESEPRADTDAAGRRRWLAELVGARHLVSGTLSMGTGESISLQVRLWEPAVTTEPVGLVEIDGTIDGLGDTIGELESRLLATMGLDRTEEPHAAASTATLPASREAAEAYLAGLAELRRFDLEAALKDLQTSARLEPSFALAHSALADAWRAVGNDPAERRAAQRAWELRDNLGRREQILIEARFHRAHGRWDEATGALRSLRRFYPADLEVALQLAEVEVAAGRPEPAMDLLEELQELSADPRIDLQWAAAGGAMSDFTTQLEHSRRARVKGRTLGSNRFVADATAQIGWALHQLGRNDEAVVELDQARVLYRSVGDVRGDAAAALSLGSIAWHQARFEQAETFLGEAARGFAAVGHRAGEVRAINGLGAIATSRARLAEATELLQTAVAGARELEDSENLARALNNLASALSVRGLLEASVAASTESATLRRRQGDLVRAVWTEINAASCLIRLGRLDDAADFVERAGATAETLDDAYLRTLAVEARASLALAAGDFESARRLAEEAEGPAAGETNRGWLLSDVLATQARIAFEQGELEEASTLFERALGNAQTSSGPSSIWSLRLHAARAALAAGDRAGAEAAANEVAEQMDEQESPRAGEAWALVARARYADGRSAEAREALSLALEHRDLLEERSGQIETDVAVLEVSRSAPERSAARRRLEAATAEFDFLGADLALERSRLGLLIADAAADSAAAGPEIEAFARAARERGFGLVAREAEALLSPSPL